MDRLRISCTDVDALRWFDAQEDMDLDAILRRLRREEPPSEAMLAGTAFHRVLEEAEGEIKGAERDGFTFSFEGDFEVSLPAIREIKATADYLIDGCRITLVGKTDAVHGRTIYDHKLTGRFDADRYLGSFQSRGYMEIFDADRFIWNVFEARESAPRNYLITAMHPLATCRYPGMKAAVKADLRRFLDFARNHLPERITTDPEPWELMAAG